MLALTRRVHRRFDAAIDKSACSIEQKDLSAGFLFLIRGKL